MSEREYYLPHLRKDLARAKKRAKAEKNDHMITLLEAMKPSKLTTAEGNVITSYLFEGAT